MFIYPTVTNVTSGFRTASRPNHYGVDFAMPGYHEIRAAESGVVSRSYRSTSYGEVVFIVHEVNGDIWETVYAHMRTGSRRVREGDRVEQGQIIGVMGNTGDSTGQHLHFEIHKGRWNMNKTNAVNPLRYLQTEPEPLKPPKPKDQKLYRIMTGTFATLEDLVEARKNLLKEFNWIVYYKADNLKFNPPMRLYTGTFRGKNVAKFYADLVRSQFRWTVYVIDAR
ncbi:M23 family metallopeptidase [Bacillaceae bacterium W0354]